MRRFRLSAATVGLLVTVVLMLSAMAVPPLVAWDVHISFPPLFASWRPRAGPGSLVAIPLAALGVAYGPRMAERLPWPRLMVLCWLGGLTWLAALLLVDAHRGAQSYPDVNDLLTTARSTGSVSGWLHGFISRIPEGPQEWPTHVAGHPPGAVLFFLALVRTGLGANIAAGIVIVLLASTTSLAVLTTLRVLDAEPAARRAAPFLVLAPAAIWEAVSFDAVLTCLSTWALAVLAFAAVRRSRGWALVAGVMFGLCLEMSYGLPLLVFLAGGVAVSARSFRAPAWAVLGALLVVVAVAVAGFALWDAYPALRGRYVDGIGGLRPASYWVWGDLAALAFSAGPAAGAAVGLWLSDLRRSPAAADLRDQHVVSLLGGAALVTVLAADASLMSKAEVERIWLPFVPWLLVLTALFPPPWRRPALAVQVLLALLVQHLLVTAW